MCRAFTVRQRTIYGTGSPGYRQTGSSQHRRRYARIYQQANITGLTVSKQDSSALAQAIISLLKDRQKIKTFGQAARETALSEYALNSVATMAIETYKQAVKRHMERGDQRIYRKSPELLVGDLDGLLSLYHNRLHQFGEDLSIRYRARKWMHMLKSRPRLLLGYAGLTMGKFVAACLRPTPASFKNKLARLEAQLDQKMQSPSAGEHLAEQLKETQRL